MNRRTFLATLPAAMAGPWAAPRLGAATPAGRFFAVGGINGTGPDGELREAEFGTIAVSRDGREWETVFKGGMVKDGFSHANNNLIRGIAHGGGRYVAVGNPGVGILASDDGRSWEHVTKYKDGLDGFNVCAGGGLFVVARAGDLLRSEDGRAWTRHATPVEGRRTWGEGGLGHMRQVAFGNGRFVCVGDNRVAVTRDGKAYEHVAFHSENGYAGRHTILFGAGRFLWLRTTGHKVSVDGVEWQPLVIGGDDTEPARTAQAVGSVWAGDRFLVGGRDHLFESRDGLNWERVEAKGYVRPAAAGGGVVVGKGSVSPDGGRTWGRHEPGVPQREIVFLPHGPDEDR